MQVAVLGATGCVGERVGAALRDAGTEYLAIERGAAVGADPAVPLLVVAGASEAVRATILTALDAGRDVVDVDRDPGQVAWLHEVAAAHAPGRGGRIVAGAGVRWAIGDLLASVAAADLDQVEEVHVTYTAGGGRAAATPGERRAQLASLTVPALARVDGRRVEEPAGAARRLAWFPRPVGPSHAAGVPGGEVYSIPLHHPEAATIRTYEALPGWRAEWLQAEANLARTRWGQRWFERRLLRPRPAPGVAGSAARRWGCVVEVRDGRRLGRAWAYGHDPVRGTAEVAVLLTGRLVAARAAAGSSPAAAATMVAASQLGRAGTLLDHLAVRTDLRWSRASVELPDR
ncbi:MAG: hypothetical protein ACNA8R_01495 [Nitriliruptoraceae bacterium]